MGFTLSPSVNNAKSTESTLKFAVAAGMVKVKPIATKGKVNFKTLAAELRAHIEKQEQVIDENNRQLENIMRMQNKLRLEIENKKKGVSSGGDDDQKLPDGVQTATRTVARVNDDGDTYEETEEYYVDADGQEVMKPIGTGMQAVNGADREFSPTTPSQISRQTSDAVQRVLSGLDDTEKEFMKGLGDDFLEQMAEDGLMSNESGNEQVNNANGSSKGGRARTVTMEENQEALKVAMEQYKKLSIPWQKEKLLK